MTGSMTKPPLKLLWIFSSFAPGPAAARFVALARGFDDSYEHVVGAMDGDFSAGAAIPLGVRWRQLAPPKKKRSMLSIGALWNARKVLLDERPHLLLTSNYDALEWLMLNRGPGATPHVHFEDPDGDEPALDDVDPARNWARRRAFPGRERRFVAASHAGEQLFVERWGAPAEQVALIPTGVGLETAATARQARGEAASQVVIGAAGPLIASKRFDRMLRLVATLRDRGRDVRAVVMGDGPERAALETEIATLGLGDVAEIIATPTDLPAALAGLDLYVSTAERELAPVELAAAMAAGLPAAISDVGEVKRMLSDANRLFVRPAGDESALVAAAEILCSDAALRAEIGAANRARAEAEYGLPMMIERFDALFREMTKGSSLLMLPAPEKAEEKKTKPGEPEVSEPAPAETVEAKGETKDAAKADIAIDAAPSKASPKKRARRSVPVAAIRPLDAEVPLGKTTKAAKPAKSSRKSKSGDARL